MASLSSKINSIRGEKNNNQALEDLNNLLTGLEAKHNPLTGGRRFTHQQYDGDVSLNKLLSCFESLEARRPLAKDAKANEILFHLVRLDSEASSTVAGTDTAWRRKWAQALGNAFTGKKQVRLERLLFQIGNNDRHESVQRALLNLRREGGKNHNTDTLRHALYEYLEGKEQSLRIAIFNASSGDLEKWQMIQRSSLTEEPFQTDIKTAFDLKKIVDAYDQGETHLPIEAFPLTDRLAKAAIREARITDQTNTLGTLKASITSQVMKQLKELTESSLDKAPESFFSNAIGFQNEDLCKSVIALADLQKKPQKLNEDQQKLIHSAIRVASDQLSYDEMKEDTAKSQILQGAKELITELTKQLGFETYQGPNLDQIFDEPNLSKLIDQDIEAKRKDILRPDFSGSVFTQVAKMPRLTSYLDLITHMNDNEAAWEKINVVLLDLNAEHKASTGERRFVLRSKYEGDVSLDEVIACVESLAEKTGHLKGHQQATRALTQLIIKDFEAGSDHKQPRLESLHRSVYAPNSLDGEVQKLLLALRQPESKNKAFKPLIRVIKYMVEYQTLPYKNEKSINDAVHSLKDDDRSVLSGVLQNPTRSTNDTTLFREIERALGLSDFVREIDRSGVDGMSIPHTGIYRSLFEKAKKNNPIGTFLKTHPDYAKLNEETVERKTQAKTIALDYSKSITPEIVSKLKTYSTAISQVKDDDLVTVTMNSLGSAPFEREIYDEIYQAISK